jgi:hypothetical protein
LTNQFNSVSRKEFFNVISTSFPELLPLTTLFYENADTVHHKWDDGSWRTLLMKEGVSQGCPLSPLFASLSLHASSSPSTNYSANVLLIDWPQATPAMMALAVYHTSSDMWMTSPLAFTFTTSHSSATLSSLSALPSDAL